MSVKWVNVAKPMEACRAHIKFCTSITGYLVIVILCVAHSVPLGVSFSSLLLPRSPFLTAPSPF